MPPYIKGKAILASALNATDELARRGAALPGAPGASGTPPGTLANTGRYVSVIGRGIESPGALSSHTYTVLVPSPGGGGGVEYELDWKDLLVRYPLTLVDPDAQKNLSFSPAAVVGDADWTAQPWRAWGIMHRMPGFDADDNPVYVFELFGIGLVFGCDPPK